MKRIYIQPAIRLVLVPAASLCSASELNLPVNDDPQTDGTADGHGHRSSWGNLWNND